MLVVREKQTLPSVTLFSFNYYCLLLLSKHTFQLNLSQTSTCLPDSTT